MASGSGTGTHQRIHWIIKKDRYYLSVVCIQATPVLFCVIEEERGGEPGAGVNDRPVDGQSRALTEPQREETPLASAIKEPSFVCQGKRGFLVVIFV